MRQVFYLIQKEFRQIARDRFMIGLIFIAPIIQIFILGNAVNTEVFDVGVVIHDADRTPLSREVAARFTNSRYFRIAAYEDSPTSLAGYLDRGEATLAVSIPRHFQRDAQKGRSPALQLLVDALDGNAAGIAVGYVAEIARDLQASVTSATRGNTSSTPAGGSGFRRSAEAEIRFWYNPNLETRVYLVPGIMAIILVIVTVFLTSMGIVREMEAGTLEQLMVTPIRSWQLVLGKIIPFSILGFIEMTLVMLFIYLIFGIGIAGSIALMFAESALFILTTLGLGIFISTVAQTQQQALFLAWFFMIFAMLLSGFFIPIANMPPAVQLLTYANPVRFFMTILREIYLKGSGIGELYPETLALAGSGILVFGAAVWRFRKRLG